VKRKEQGGSKGEEAESDRMKMTEPNEAKVWWHGRLRSQASKERKQVMDRERTKRHQEVYRVTLCTLCVRTKKTARLLAEVMEYLNDEDKAEKAAAETKAEDAQAPAQGKAKAQNRDVLNDGMDEDEEADEEKDDTEKETGDAAGLGL